MRISRRKKQLMVLGVMAVLLVCCGQSTRQGLFFLEKAKGLGRIIITQASADMNLCKMYNTVWEYAKVTNLDFESAYQEMMLDTSEIKSQMETNRQMMDRMMNTIKGPPKDMTAIHDKLIELREFYIEFNTFILQMPATSQEKFNAEADVYLEKINSLKSELDRLISEAEAAL